MELFKNYPYAQSLIEEHHLEDFVQTMQWHSLGPKESIAALAEQILNTNQALVSSNIPQIIEGKEQAAKDYQRIGNNLHVFAKEQARHELELSNEDVTRIFAKVELGGARYLKPNENN